MTNNNENKINENIENADITIDKTLAVEDGKLEEMESRQENNIEDIKEEKVEKKSSVFGKLIQAVVLDQIIVGAVSYALLLLTDLFLRYVVGAYIADMPMMYIVIVFVLEVLYPIIFGSTKCGNTIGRKLSGLSSINK